MKYKRKKILFIDFDTLFSSYLQNTGTLRYDTGEFSDLRIILPQIKNIESTIKYMINSLSCNSIIILDSLNGLIDSLSMLNLYKMKNTITEDKKKSRHKSVAGYQSLNILSLLLKKTENKKIPIVITIYQSLEKSKKMVNGILLNDDLETNNHFFRISNTVLFLEFDEDDYRTGFTIIKNKSPIFPYSSTCRDPHPKVFFPYSRWFYYDFVKL